MAAGLNQPFPAAGLQLTQGILPALPFRAHGLGNRLAASQGLSGLAHNTSYIRSIYKRFMCVCVCAFTWHGIGKMLCLCICICIFLYIYIYNGFGENPIFASLKLGCLRGVTGLQVCRLLPSQLFIWGLSQLSLRWQVTVGEFLLCVAKKNALKRLNLYMFLNMTIYICCLFTIYKLYYVYIYICVDLRYNYTSMQTKVCIMYSDVYTYTNSYRIWLNKTIFQGMCISAVPCPRPTPSFWTKCCWTCCCPYYLHIYIYIVVLALKPSRNEFEPSPSDRPYISNQIRNTQPPLQRLKNISSFWDIPRIGSGCWPLSLWTRIKLLQFNYNMAMAQTHVPL